MITVLAQASLAAPTPDQNKLQLLNKKITTLKQSLTTARDKHGLLNRELAQNEKQISANLQTLKQLNGDMNSKKQSIHQLEQKTTLLNKELNKQQELLAKHIIIRYKMGAFPPIKWILNQDKPDSITELLTFHDYLVQNREHLISQIDANKKSLMADQATLKQNISDLQAIESKLHLNQEQLERNKAYHTAVINNLHQEIRSKEQTLADFEQNKKNLTQLLTNLSSRSVGQVKQPFSRMRHRLPKPLAVSAQRTNQGLTFFAGEGTPVHAVFPGKIVFSDWLNGYGLLLIIDHGQGFMTLYAHNQSLLKHKGNFVSQQEQIATVGHSGGAQKNGLYFEVRQGGRVVSPLEWLA